MIKIVLEPARNGVIKRIIDDNHGGGKERWSSTDVYESSDDDTPDYHYVMKFFYELCEDLGINLGNKFNKKVVKIDTTWGTHYEPSPKEIDSKIKELEAEIQLLKEWKNS